MSSLTILSLMQQKRSSLPPYADIYLWF